MAAGSVGIGYCSPSGSPDFTEMITFFSLFLSLTTTVSTGTGLACCLSQSGTPPMAMSGITGALPSMTTFPVTLPPPLGAAGLGASGALVGAGGGVGTVAGLGAGAVVVGAGFT